MKLQLALLALIFVPGIVSLLLGFFWRSDKVQWAGGLGIIGLLISLGASLYFVSVGVTQSEALPNINLFSWIEVGSLNISIGFELNKLSSIMTSLVCFVGLMVHIFSLGYMDHDNRPVKYFSFLNLFIFSMLILITGSNLLTLFMGWEGVGFCSYLLIGFWFNDISKSNAALKAFIVNRISDGAFILGMFFIYKGTGSLDFEVLRSALSGVELINDWRNPLYLGATLLFVGAMGKSAQFPMYIWLPDAMAGPTPASALIHAATMVTAGIFLLIKLSFLYVTMPGFLIIVAVIGCVTLVWAALLGCVQTDIKKVLAYSTVSQLGYMMLAVGVGAFTSAFFHLLTHGFFKALLFLGAANIIHSLDGEQNIFKMGGLKSKLPVTTLCFAIGHLALIGLPPLSGFFSKDQIIWASLASSFGHSLFWLAAIVGAILTAFYMTRLMVLVFFREENKEASVHCHGEPQRAMLVPIVVLSIFAVFSGLISLPQILVDTNPKILQNYLGDFLKDQLATVPFAITSHGLELALLGVTLFAVIASSWLAYTNYIKANRPLSGVFERWPRLRPIIDNHFYVDFFVIDSVVKPFINICQAMWLYIDQRFVDRIVLFIADMTQSIALANKKLQDGRVQSYLLYLIVSIVFILSYALLGN